MFGDKGKRDGVSHVKKKRANSHRNNSTKDKNNKKQLEEQVSKLGSKPEKSFFRKFYKSIIPMLSRQ